MPNAKILNEKKEIVEELTGKLKSKAGVFVNYSGITVNEDTEMRVRMRTANVDYTVIKNTLMRFAIKNVGFEALDPILNGTTSLAVSNEDQIAPARIIKEYADKFANYFVIKGGFMDGKILSVDEVNALAAIPALPILQAQVLGTMLAPITSLAVVLKAIAEKGGVPADVDVAVSEKEPAPAEPAAEEPAAVAEEAPAEPVVEEPAAVAEEAPAEPVVEEPAAVAEEAPAEPAAEEPAAVAEEAPAEPVVEESAAVAEKAPAEPAAEEPAPVKTAKKAPSKAAGKTPAEPVAEEAPAEAVAEEPVPAKAAKKAPAKVAKDTPANNTK